MPATSRSGFLGGVATLWRNHSYMFVFVVIFVAYIFTLQLTGKTFNVGHISSIIASQNTVIVGTMAIGMGLVIITGQIDLSVGSAMVLCSGVTAVVFNLTGGNILLTVLAALAAGVLLGSVNGFLAAYANMPPFIVTLGTMLMYRSLALFGVRAIPSSITGSSSSQFSPLSTLPGYDFLRMKFGTGSLPIYHGFAIPYVSLLFGVCVAAFVLIAANTKYGKAVYAVGSNAKAARLAGVHVERIKASVFMVTGFLVGVASLIQVAKVGGVTPASSGRSFELYAIAAVVLGGIAMAGGRGRILGVLFGALSYCTINFIIVGIPALTPDIQDTFQGLVLILVILVQTAGPSLRERLRPRRRLEAEGAVHAPAAPAPVPVVTPQPPKEA